LFTNTVTWPNLKKHIRKTDWAPKNKNHTLEMGQYANMYRLLDEDELFWLLRHYSLFVTYLWLVHSDFGQLKR